MVRYVVIRAGLRQIWRLRIQYCCNISHPVILLGTVYRAAHKLLMPLSLILVVHAAVVHKVRRSGFARTAVYTAQQYEYSAVIAQLITPLRTLWFTLQVVSLHQHFRSCVLLSKTSAHIILVCSSSTRWLSRLSPKSSDAPA